MSHSENWYAIEKRETLEKLGSHENGISDSEALFRLEKYGKNEIKQIYKVNPWSIFLKQFNSVFILILLAAALFSFFIKHYIDFAAIMVLVLLNSFIGFFQQFRAERTISEMRELLVPKVKVFRAGIMKEISSLEIVPGDIVLVSEGDKIMADCRILHENELETNEAILTGESFSQRKGSEILKIDAELANRENMLFMGTVVVRGSGKAIVVSTGMNTEFGKIAELVQKINVQKTPLEKKLNEFSKRVAVVIIVLTILSIIIGIFRGEEAYQMILTGIALAISVIPEGVPAIIAITLAFAIKRMHASNALIRKLPAAETLGRTSVICVDKTGTLTEEEMTVTKIFCNREMLEIKDRGVYSNNKKLDRVEIEKISLLLKTGIMCNNARIEKDANGKILNIIGDPTEKALVMTAEKLGLLKKEETEKERRIIEYSFSSKRKLMSIIRKSDGARISYVKGAPDVLIKRCSKEYINGRLAHLTSKRKEELMAVCNEMSAQALRVLGFAFRKIEMKNALSQEIAETDLIFVGFEGMMDPPRKEVKGAIKDCIDAGIKIKMVTGDSLLTAEAVSKMIGLDGGSIDGKMLEKLSEEDFNKAVISKTIFARITPEIKLKIVQALKASGEIVAVTGDGVNDVLALKEAHIGVAMGIRGSEVSREVADIILLDDNFNSIVNAVREGRRVYDNMKKSIKAQIAANVHEFFVVLFALLIAWPIPLMPLAILWMNLITDSLPSLSLSVEPADKEIMRRRPIARKEHILTGLGSFLLIAGVLAFIATIGLFAFFFNADLEKARTVAITTAVFCEMFVVLSCRSDKNIWKIGWFSNKLLLFSVATAVILQLIAIYTPLANVFGFVPLSLTNLIAILLASFPIFVVFEAWKFWKNQKYER